MKSKIDYSTSHFYKQAKKDLNLKITSAQYSKILELFSQVIQDKVLTSYFGYKIPKNGRIRVCGSKTRSRVIDKYMSQKLSKRIYIFNDHSEGIRFRFSWIQPNYKISNVYKFVPVRQFSRALAAKIKSRKYNYIIE